MSTRTASALRALILHGLLMLLLLLLGTGLSLLISMGLSAPAVNDDRQLLLATALAFTIIPGPLVWALWLWIRKKLLNAEPTEAAIWSLQGSAVYLIALVISSTAVLQLLGSLIGGGASQGWQDQVGLVLGWGAIGLWQFKMLTTPKYVPSELPHLAVTLGNAYALVLAGYSLVVALRTALELVFVPQAILVGQGPLPRLLGAVIWVLGASILWLWHWKMLQVQKLRDIFASFVVMLLGVALAALTALLAAAATLNIIIPLPWDSTAMGDRFASFGPLAISALLTGAIFWMYHHGQLAGRSPLVTRVSRQIISGISLAILASGLGMVVNALLASISSPLNTDTAPAVLRTGIALVLVGTVFWVTYFQPGSQSEPESRRVYLVLFFGVSAVVALVALLIVGYRVFEMLVGAASPALNMLDYIRAPLGWLLATVGVSAYHFALWKSDREKLTPLEPEARRRLILVAPQGSEQLLSALQLTEGLEVRWIVSSHPPLPEEWGDELTNRLLEALATHSGSLLAVADEQGQFNFTPLA